jgi:hypothetical protein
MIRLALAVVGGVLVLFVAQIAFAFLTPPAPQPPPSALLAVLLSNALSTAMLVALARRMPAAPPSRAVALWAIWGGIQTNSLIELFLFDIGITHAQTGGLIAYALATAALTAAFVGWVAPPAPVSGAGRMTTRPVWLALAPPLYIACYLTAGSIVWPFIAEFYQAHAMPAIGQVVALQVVRGLIFGAIVLLIVRSCEASRATRTALAALTLAILGGVAPLVMPNSLMPPPVRLAHLFEVVPSIGLFGAVLAWALTANHSARIASTGASRAARTAG